MGGRHAWFFRPSLYVHCGSAQMILGYIIALISWPGVRKRPGATGRSIDALSAIRPASAGPSRWPDGPDRLIPCSVPLPFAAAGGALRASVGRCRAGKTSAVVAVLEFLGGVVWCACQMSSAPGAREGADHHIGETMHAIRGHLATHEGVCVMQMACLTWNLISAVPGRRGHN